MFAPYYFTKDPVRFISRIFISFFILSMVALAQPEEEKWSKIPIEYGITKGRAKRDYSFKNEDGNFSLIKSLLVTYRIFFSDLDGEHCPYSPSCSQFAYEASKTVGIIEAVPITFDRLARDLNIFRNYKKMRINQYGKIDDPIEQRAISILRKVEN